MNSTELIIDQTKKWINEVVIGCNFCPFAAKVVKRNAVHYTVAETMTLDLSIPVILEELLRMDHDQKIETSFLIFPDGFHEFNDYLEMVSMAENLLSEKSYEGIYQLASFHPLYQFADSSLNDSANYTNRSVYPMLHILREESIDNALKLYENPEKIPERNIDFAREKGPAYMKMLRDSCLNV